MKHIVPVLFALLVSAGLSPAYASAYDDAVANLRAKNLLTTVVNKAEAGPKLPATLEDLIITASQVANYGAKYPEGGTRTVEGKPSPGLEREIAELLDSLRLLTADFMAYKATTNTRFDGLSKPVVETIPSAVTAGPVAVRTAVTAGPGVRSYVAGISMGAALGLASYLTSVQFDNMSRDNLKAYTIAGDSTTAARFGNAASRYQTLGDVFYCASYPLIAIGFYAGFSLARRVFPERMSFLDENSPTRVCCSLDKNLNLSMGIRKSIW